MGRHAAEPGRHQGAVVSLGATLWHEPKCDGYRALAARRDGALRYMGWVGTGFDDDAMAEIAARLTPLSRTTPPVEVPRGDARGLRGVTPKLAAEVR